ncbi:acylphosphatase-2-like [Arctopsyche grandis]|uniref:acylphosphatase-2-like n=1 Tax=Arctopsyche grandis TaxID=121162 RepID=UPI00406D6809
MWIVGSRVGLATTVCFSVCLWSPITRYFSAKMTSSLVGLDFEVFGRVQGVFFRKCTEEEADKLGVRGWCKNTPQGTVQGQIEGPETQVQSMKHWLEFTGSPMSKIDRVKFDNERQINEYTFNDFSVKRRPKNN